MASIRKEIVVDVDAADLWDALRDWGQLHRRLVAGFALDARLDGEDRIVTFANGAVVRERFVALDEERRRLAWSIADGPYEHHNGVAEVLDEGEGRSRFVWTADVLPHALAERTGQLMEQGTQAVKRTLEA